METLPVETWGAVVRAMKPDGFMYDWIVAERMCEANGNDIEPFFTQWIRGQEAGKQFGIGGGSEEEMDFVRRHVEGKRRGSRGGCARLIKLAVFLGEVVSVAVVKSPSRSGGAQVGGMIWLCKESGWLPPCERGSCEEKKIEEGARKAYLGVFPRGYKMVSGADSGVVLLAELTEESVRICVEWVIPELRWLEGKRDSDHYRHARAFFKSFTEGKFSSGAQCRCAGNGDWVCGACQVVARERRLFISSIRYEGLYPFGEGHWFTGVTDMCWAWSGSYQWLFCRRVPNAEPQLVACWNLECFC